MSPDVEQPKARPEELAPPLQQEGFIVANPGNEFVVAIEIHTDSVALDSGTKDPIEREDPSSKRASGGYATGPDQEGKVDMRAT